MTDAPLWIPAAAVEKALEFVEECRRAKAITVHTLDRDDPARRVLVASRAELGELQSVLRELLAPRDGGAEVDA